MRLVLSLCTFVATMCLTMSLVPAWTGFWSAVRRAYGGSGIGGERSTAPLHQLFPLLHVLGAFYRGERWGKYRPRLQALLSQAGAPHEIGANEVLGACTLSAIVTFVAALLVLKGLFELSLLFCVLGALGGSFAPILWLRSHGEDRRTAIHRQLPYMLDLVVMTMEAGSLFYEAVTLYVGDHRDEPLADEWQIFLNERSVGKSHRDALQNLAARVDSVDLRNLVATIIQGEECGTPLGVLLRIYADNLRLKRTQRAEKLAGEAAVRILGPSMVMMIAVVLIILGPIFIRYLRGGMLM